MKKNANQGGAGDVQPSTTSSTSTTTTASRGIGSFPGAGFKPRTLASGATSTSVEYVSEKLKELNLLGKGVDDIKKSFRPSPITDAMFLGGRLDAVNYQHLYVAGGIRLILCCTEEHAQEVRKQQFRFGKIVVPQRKTMSGGGGSGGANGEIFEPAAGCRTMEDFLQFMREDVAAQKQEREQNKTSEKVEPSMEQRDATEPSNHARVRGEASSVGLASEDSSELSSASVAGTTEMAEKKTPAQRRTSVGTSSATTTTTKRRSVVVSSTKTREAKHKSTPPPQHQQAGAGSSGASAAKTYSFYWACVPVRDVLSTKLDRYFQETSMLLEAAEDTNGGSVCNGRVLVHCLAGRSRSVSILCAYLVKRIILARAQATSDPTTPTQVLKVPLTVAVLDFMRERRMCIQPNESFYQQLLEWEQKLQLSVCKAKQQKRNSVLLEASGEGTTPSKIGGPGATAGGGTASEKRTE